MPNFKADFVYSIDFRSVKYYRDLYGCIKTGLALPDFFGENRDALWDCLTGFIGWPCEIRLSGRRPSISSAAQSCKRSWMSFQMPKRSTRTRFI